MVSVFLLLFFLLGIFNGGSFLEPLFKIFLCPYIRLINTGIYCKCQDHDITFEFIKDPETRILNELRSKIGYKENHLNLLQKEVHFLSINQKLQSPTLKIMIRDGEQQFIYDVCSDIPNAFWERKRHIISLPYIQGFDERYQIPTKF